MLGLAFALIGCGPAPTSLRAVHRFVDADQRKESSYSFDGAWNPEVEVAMPTQDPQFHVEGIGNDYRYVLSTAPSVRLPGAVRLRTGPDGKVDHVPVLPQEIRGAEEVLVLPKLQIEDRSFDLDPFPVRAVHAYGAIWIPIHMKIPEQYRERDAVLTFQVYGLLWGPKTRIEVPEVVVPKDAVLGFAVGVLNPMRLGATVRFSVDACWDGKCERLDEREVSTKAKAADRPWEDLRVGLPKLAGRRVRFVFGTEVLGKDGPSRIFPLWAHPTIYEKVEQPEEQGVPRVILVSLDTLSARHLKLYGYGQDTAPAMTKVFEQRGTVFENCVAAGTATVPSHMSMFTGYYPIENNMTDGSTRVSDGAIPVAAVAREHGVETAAFTEDAWVSVDLGYGRGFDQFLENRSSGTMTPEGHAASTFGAAKSWIARNKDKSFLLFIHTYQVHNPYVPSEPYLGLFKSSEVDREAGTALEQVGSRIAYDQEIRGVDDEIESLLKQLDELKLADSTLLIVTSDHGEQFGEHGYIQHSNFLHEEVLHVPLMMIGPGVMRGARVSSLVGHVDYRPTILDFLGVKDSAEGLRGRSLRQLASRGKDVGNWEERVMFSESWGTAAITSKNEVELFYPPALSARSGALKLARYKAGDSYRYEAYDLSVDPHERQNLADAEPMRFSELRQRLDSYEAEAEGGRARLQMNGESHSAPIKLDPEQEQKLKALGYLQ